MNNISVLSRLQLPGSRHEVLELVRSPEIRAKIINAGFFNLAWLVCVVGRQDMALAGLVLTAIYYLSTVRSAGYALRVFVVPAILGILVDTLLTRLDIYKFGYEPLLVPLWLAVLWFAFSSTLTRSLDFLAGRPVLAGVFGGVGFAFSYGMGHHLGAVEFGVATPLALVLIGLTWACLLPMVYVWLERVR